MKKKKIQIEGLKKDMMYDYHRRHKLLNGRSLAAFMCLMLGITGCSAQAPDLSEEQSALVAEYAAGVLLKHNKNYSGKIVDEAVIERQLAKEKAFAENTAEFQKLLEEKEAEKKTSEASAQESAQKSSMTMEEFAAFLGISPASLSYSGIKVCDSYPDADEGEVIFEMTATQGNKLCVLEFELANTTASDVEVNVYDKKLRFSVLINGSITQGIQSTYALEDLSAYQAAIPAGESRSVILVLELPEEDAQAIQTLTLLAKGNAGNARITLQ